MNIDRQNYEAFFLMYVDEELTAEECAAVDTFVAQNPDLAPELEMLQQARLTPETELTFNNKALLYKTAEGIQLNNYELYFLLYVDEELSPAEKTAVETFVLQHPQLQQEFTLLQQTRVEAETISFGNKASLYRSAKRRVVPITWLRMAAAAAVIGIISMVYGLWPTPTTKSNVDLVKQTEPINTGANKPTTKPAEPTVLVAPKQEIAQAKEPDLASDNSIEKPAKQPTKEERAPFATRKNITKEVPPASVIRQEEKLIAPATAQPNFNEDVLAAKINSGKHQGTTVKPDELTGTTFAATKPNNEEVYQQAVYRELDVEAAENENTFLIGSAQINKNKLRGLLKKATGLFDKKGDKPDSDKKIKIAMFELR